LTNEGGTDATDKFEEVFHSDDARHQLKDFCVGTLEGYTGPSDAALTRGKKSSSSNGTKTQSGGAGSSPVLFLLGAAAVGAALYFLVL
jgi:cytochrome b involved in lipid metabolism